MQQAVYNREADGKRGARLLRVLFILIWAIAAVHIVSETMYLYWTYRWLDIPMHFVGGVWVGLVALWLRYYSGYLRKKEGLATHPFIVALVGGVAFGLVWELFEYLVWVLGPGLPLQYVPDTLLDLVMDTLGAVVAYGIYAAFDTKVPDVREEPIT